MELERIRRVLAERAMEWKPERSLTSTWYASKDGLDYRISDAKYAGLMLTSSDWHPDTDWQQCGWVIKKMREKEWGFRFHSDIDGPVVAIFWKGCEVNAKHDKFCYAVALAAARALEATDG